MNTDWNTTPWGLCLRVIWLALVVGLLIAGCLVIARFCAWADTGSRGECPVEKSVIPAELR